MEEFDAPQEHGVKQMRETIGRKDDTIKKLEAELESYKDKEIDNVFGKILKYSPHRLMQYYN